MLAMERRQGWVREWVKAPNGRERGGKAAAATPIWNLCK